MFAYSKSEAFTASPIFVTWVTATHPDVVHMSIQASIDFCILLKWKLSKSKLSEILIKRTRMMC